MADNPASRLPATAAVAHAPPVTSLHPVDRAMESPLLQLEVDALLSETSPLPEEVAVFEGVVERLKQALLQLKSGQVGPEQAEAYLDSLGLSGMGSFPFHPPTGVTITGSSAQQSLAKPNLVIDVAVTIPKACFYEKDHLDCKYHGKRALWLTIVAGHLKKHAVFKQQEWLLLNNDARKPALLLKPLLNSGSSATFSIRLIPTITQDTFPLAKHTPHRGNLRPATAAARSATAAAAVPASGVKGQKKRKRADADADADQAFIQGKCDVTVEPRAAVRLPTPHYNTSILADMMVDDHQQALQSAIDAIPKLCETLVLLKVWMRKHDPSNLADGFGGFLVSMFAVHLVQQNRLNHAMSHVQLLRTILHGLADPRTFSQGLFMQWGESQGSRAATAPSQQAMRKAFEVVFVDGSGWCNLAAHVSRSALKQLQGCAKRSVSLLDRAAAGQHTFDPLFLTKQSPLTTYDYLFHVSIPQPQAAQLQTQDVPRWVQAEKKLLGIVKQALGPRAVLVRVHQRRHSMSSPKKVGITPPGNTILVGVQVDPAAALQIRDMGPPADDVQAAAKFRQFWGDKAELRRFQDGNIAEAVVWECGPAERHSVVDRIVTYALGRHLPAGSAVSRHADCLDSVLQSKHAEANAQIQASRQLDAAVDRLSKQIRGLTNLTLKVVSTQPLSSTSRHTAPFYPLPHPLAGGGPAGTGRIPRCLEATELMLQLEGSGKWADDPEAFRKMKAALGVQLAQVLETSFGLDAEASEDYVDVLTDGFAIRLFLFSNRDEVMAARADKESNQPSVSKVLSQRAQHHGLVSGLTGQNAAFSMAARLAVRWVAAHMMAGTHLPVEAVELIMTAAFLPASAAVPPPGSPLAGFVRFLHLLSQHPWGDRPLVVDTSAELTPAQHKDIDRRFDAAKAKGQLRGFTICTPTDLGGSAWGQSSMSAGMRQRLVKLAGRSLQVLQVYLPAQCSEPLSATLMH
ncbi:TPA: hypothetical protein ACH3X1_000480 [Trebouxia sp. C0004]